MAQGNKLGILFLLISICYSLGNVSARDDTLVEFATGKEITEAVLRKISRSEIFPEDNSFLVRLAYVESKFGQDNTTFREDYYGGIWQVEESVLGITQTNHSTLVPLHKAIESKFQIDWTKITWKHLVTPLYSGLAAALYFARVPEVIPQTLTAQAAHWIKYYRPLGEIPKFEEDSEELRNQTRCRGKMDLCIVLDGSGSINQVDRQNYQRAKNFVASMIESFTLDYTRIGMLVFSDDPITIFEINNRDTIGQLASLARNALYPNRGTRTDKAIFQAIEMFKRSSHGEDGDNGVPKIMTVFTDGQSDRGSNMTGAVDEIRNNNIKSVSIGIGNSLNPVELLQIALMDPRSVFTIEDFSSLQDFLQRLTSVACEIPQRPNLNTTYDDNLLQNEKRFYQIQSPPEGLTINVSVSIGKANGYWSHTEEAPSAAVHDGIIDGITFIPPRSWMIEEADEGEEGEEEEEEDAADVYITIQGVEENNNYTLSLVEGDQFGVGTTEIDIETTTESGDSGDSGAGNNALAKYYVLLGLIFFVLGFN